MTSTSTSKISRILLGILFFSLTCTVIPAQTQDYTEEEYKTFQEIQATTDGAKKVDMIVKFLQEKPKTGLRSYLLPEYQTVIVELQNKKEWDRIIVLADKFLDAVPNDDFSFSALAAAYSATNNTKGFANFGEKAYASKPSSQLAYAIAKAYQSLGNEAKFLQWGEKALAGDSSYYEIAAELTRSFLKSQNTDKATKYARICLKALPTAKKPEGVDDKAWKNATDNYYATAYYAIGAAAYNSQNYPQAISNLDSAVKYYKRNDMAYYYLGMSNWQLNKLQPAMLNFAKAYVLKGPTSTSARQSLEKLWKSGHRGSLDGINVVIQRAEQELR